MNENAETFSTIYCASCIVNEVKRVKEAARSSMPPPPELDGPFQNTPTVQEEGEEDKKSSKVGASLTTMSKVTKTGTKALYFVTEWTL